MDIGDLVIKIEAIERRLKILDSQANSNSQFVRDNSRSIRELQQKTGFQKETPNLKACVFTKNKKKARGK